MATSGKVVKGGAGPKKAGPPVSSLRMVEGEPVIRLIDPQTGEVHPCKLSRVSWACNQFGLVANAKEMAEARKIISGMAEVGETIRPMKVEDDAGTAAPSRRKTEQEEPDESGDVALIPIG